MRVKYLVILFTFVLQLHSGAVASDRSEEGPWDFALPDIADIYAPAVAEESLLKRARSQEPEGAFSLSEEDLEIEPWETPFAEVDHYVASMPPADHSSHKRAQPEVSADNVSISPQKRSRSEASGGPSKGYNRHEHLGINKDIKVVPSTAPLKPSESFKQISREQQNGICFLFNAHNYLNKLILNLLSPQDVKSVMLTSRRGYWLGRTRGYIKVADPSSVRQQLECLCTFMDAMVSDADFPIKVLNLSFLCKPEYLFSSMAPDKRQLLTEKLIDYTWRTSVFSAQKYSIQSQLTVLLCCTKLRSLNITLPSENSLKEDGENTYVPEPSFAQMAASFKDLEVMRFHSDRPCLSLSDLHTIFREFKCLKIFESVSDDIPFLYDGDPFQLLENDKNPQSGLLSLPLLQEMHLDGYEVNGKAQESLVRLCPKIRKISVYRFPDKESLTIARATFSQSETLTEYSFTGFGEFILSRTRSGYDLQINEPSYPGPDCLDKVFKDIREVFPGVVVREICFRHISNGFLPYLSKIIQDVRILHLPRLEEKSKNRFIDFLKALPHLVELDLSDHYRNLLMPDSAYVSAARMVKHMNISNMAKMTPELIAKILAVQNLESLTLSLIRIREGDQVRELISEEMVQSWRKQYPNTQIKLPLQNRFLIVEAKPRKSKKKM